MPRVLRQNGPAGRQDIIDVDLFHAVNRAAQFVIAEDEAWRARNVLPHDAVSFVVCPPLFVIAGAKEDNRGRPQRDSQMRDA